uniref:DUF4832 domain-containing protein n=1 Tax=Angiostrongylus cantonensis TaxID=6313 RepID=A0A0K0D3L0_ANGCA
MWKQIRYILDPSANIEKLRILGPEVAKAYAKGAIRKRNPKTVPDLNLFAPGFWEFTIIININKETAVLPSTFTIAPEKPRD